MTLTIRPVAPDDYPALAEAANGAFPGVVHTAETIQEEDQETAPPQRAARFVAVVDGRVAGTVSYFQSASRWDPRKFWLDAYVHPDFHRRGVGTALYNHALAELLTFDPVQVRTYTREDLTHSVRFFESRGYQEKKRTWESYLTLATFDPGPYDGVEAKVLAQGIRIATLAELQADSAWVDRYHALVNAIQTDVPDIDPATPLDAQQFRRLYVESPKLLPAGMFFALDGDQWVGHSGLWQFEEAGVLNNGLTGVLPAYRGRSIALALKLRGIAWAKAQGAERIRTLNASTNRPMLAINERLGFVKRPAWMHLIWSR